MKTLLSLLAALGFSAAALAQELPSFDEVDQNGDDMISETEASQVENLDFVAADANKDGAIDRNEYSQLS